MSELIVRVPPETPADAQLFLAGDAPELGPWKADAVPLIRRSNGSYRGRITVPADGHLDYLITRGAWRLVESHPAGLERGPRWLTPSASLVGISVADWGRHSIHYHHHFDSEFCRRDTISI